MLIKFFILYASFVQCENVKHKIVFTSTGERFPKILTIFGFLAGIKLLNNFHVEAGKQEIYGKKYNTLSFEFEADHMAIAHGIQTTFNSDSSLLQSPLDFHYNLLGNSYLPYYVAGRSAESPSKNPLNKRKTRSTNFEPVVRNTINFREQPAKVEETTKPTSNNISAEKTTENCGDECEESTTSKATMNSQTTTLSIESTSPIYTTQDSLGYSYQNPTLMKGMQLTPSIAPVYNTYYDQKPYYTNDSPNIMSLIWQGCKTMSPFLHLEKLSKYDFKESTFFPQPYLTLPFVELQAFRTSESLFDINYTQNFGSTFEMPYNYHAYGIPSTSYKSPKEKIWDKLSVKDAYRDYLDKQQEHNNKFYPIIV